MKDYPKCEHTAATLKQLQSLPLRDKIFETRLRIAEWVKIWGEDKIYISFSGGLDSTVMLDIVRIDYPSAPAVFFDTGLEYPEIIDFVKTIDNVELVKPKMNFKQVIAKYGYPLISKKMAQYIKDCQRSTKESVWRLRRTGIRKDGTYSPMSKISNKWQYLTEQKDIMISNKCCDALKKQPAKIIEKRGWKPFVGIRADEGGGRDKSYEQFGCNAFELSRPRSAPMIFWTDKDIWNYIKLKNLPYSKIYDMGYKRTGCMFCAFGAHLEQTPNRFQLMEKTHPKQWNYCINKLGLGKALDLIGVNYKYQPTLFEKIDSK